MDPQVEALFQMMAAQAEATGSPPLTSLPADVARAGAEMSFQAFNQPMPEGVAITDRVIPGPAGTIPLKVFRPEGATGTLPLLVFIHGGGWVIGSPETHKKLCAELSLGAGIAVASVHYRLAPEHPAPAALDDCVAAIRWCVEHATELGADATDFAIGGDSAGGNLTAAACLRLRDEGGPQAKLQLLLYGAFILNPDTESCLANAEGKILTRDSMVWFINHYLSGGASLTDPYIAPIHGNLRGLPPARLIVGTLDPLLDDSRAFSAKLTAAGVPNTLSVYPDMPHVFLQLSSMLDGGKQGVAECVQALRARR